MNRKTFKAAFIRSVPVMAGYVVLGIGFGILAQQKGFGFWWALAMSLTVFSGTMQYVAVDLMAAGVSVLTGFATALLVNARYLFYGVTMLEHYKGVGKRKPYLIFGLTDETYAIVCSGHGPDGAEFKDFALLLTILNQLYWVTGSVLGVLAGTYIPIDFAGVDFAMTALFITVFIDQWRGTKDHLPAIIGLVSTTVCLLIFGSESFLIPAMVVIVAALLVLRKVRKEEQA